MIPKEEDLKNKLLDWLENQGYPLEMRVARSFMQSYAQVTQSDYYKDLETGVPREIDIVTRWYDYYEPSWPGISELEIYCCIECKSQQQKPWIIFTSDQGLGWQEDNYPVSEDAFKLVNASRAKLSKTSLMELKHEAGYGITQAFITGKDILYQAIMSALKSAEAKIKIEGEYNKGYNKEKDFEYKLSFLALPIVVTDAKLFRCNQDNEGYVSLKDVGVTVISCKYPFGNDRSKKGSLVYIVNEDSVSWLIKSLNEFRSVLVNHLPKIMKRIEN